METTTAQTPESVLAPTSAHPMVNHSHNHPMKNQPHKPLMKKIETKNNTMMIAVISILVVGAGILTGWLLAGGMESSSTSTGETAMSQEQKNAVTQNDKEAGVSDTSSFEKEAPIGKLVKGGIDGEGQFHLERDGGPSQNVYLTSTVIDLASFEGKKVQVWGNSLSGKKAGWLMDVGKVKVVE